MSSIYFEKTFQRSFGTYPLTGGELMAALRTALDVGYRSIDTAQAYRNEADIGRALSEIDVPRSELCITTKVDPGNFDDASFIPSVEKSLSDLRVEQVDVILLHWPPADGNVIPSLRLLERAKADGLAHNIGVSNYTATMMRTAHASLETPLVINQVEFHPLLNQDKLLAAANDTGIPLSAYCSVARGKVFDYPVFEEIGASYGKTAGQIVLRWILQKGVAINTMSTKAENMKANFDVMDFTLSSIDMHRIDSLTGANYRVVDRNVVPWAPVWD